MTLLQLIQRVRQHTRDLSNSIFREQDLIAFINEGVERFQQLIPELRGMNNLTNLNDEPNLLPKHYHHLLATYATSRAFGQDERHYQAATFMNEFETKLVELDTAINIGEIIIEDEDGNPISREELYDTEYVKDNYYFNHHGRVEGVK